jgi:Glycoside hydrolase family 44
MPLRRRAATAVMLAASVVAAALAAVPGATAQAANAGPALTIDVTAGRHAISPNIYGENFADTATAAATGVTVDRFGGNSASRFNYLNNETNTGSDYYYENVGSTPATTFVGADRSAGLSTVWELPMTGYVAKISPTSHPFYCSYPTETFPTQDSTDYWDPHCGNGVTGGNNINGADPTTTSTAEGASFDQAEVAYLVSHYGTAAAGGVPFYELDNEPSLWNSTHRDIHPNPLTYDELVSRSTATAAAVKTADPTAAVLGPSDWGWCAYFYSAADNCNDGSDRESHGDVDFAAYYLAQMKAYDTAHGRRDLDYFDEHYYPQDAVSLATAGNAAEQAQRLMETRTLWDPTYKDDSWIGTDVNTAVDLIPRMHGWVNANYPGTKLAISEYNFGGLEALNGALTEADVLGIFGREQVDLATLWSPPTATQPGAFAFRLFRNYDGSGATFGDTYVSSTSADQSKLSVYGAQRTSDGAMTVLVINKSTGDLTSNVALDDFSSSGTAQVWRYSSADLSHIVRQADVTASSSTSSPMSLTFPASSATLLVIPAASTGPTATPTTSAAPTTSHTPAPTTSAAPTTSVAPTTTNAGPTPTSTASSSRPVLAAPSSFTAPATVTFPEPVRSVPAGTVTLVDEPSGSPATVQPVCRNGTALVSCTTGPVTSVTVGPGTAWVPGQTYQLAVTMPGSTPVMTSFIAPTLVPGGSAVIAYQWATVRSPKAFGGSVEVASTRAATETIAFSGPTVTWYGPTGPALGSVDVLVDGRLRAAVNTHTAKTQDRVAHLLSHLGTGPHTLTLRVHSGTVAIDAVRVGHGKVLATPAFSATWLTGKAGASASLRFAGTGVRWATSGNATVAVFVDGLRTTAKSIIGLAAGQHTLRLVVLKGTLRLKAFQVTDSSRG